MCLYFQLRRISMIRSFVTADAVNRVAVVFILSRLDYCDSLLAGLPDDKVSKPQRIQNIVLPDSSTVNPDVKAHTVFENSPLATC